MESSKRSTSSSRRAKLLLVVFGIVVGALIAEVSLRIIGYSFPEFYQPDETRGYALRPNMSGWYRKEGEAFVAINSAGLRDREHSQEKPPGTIRIAVLGDSYPEAFPVPRENAFWAVMENRLQSCNKLTGKTVEVLNFGVSGYGTAQELLTLREKVWDYSPDIVMLAITTNNDITDNSQPLKKTDEVPYFVYNNGKLTLDDSFKTSRAFVLRQSAMNRFGRWIRDHSRLVQAINQGHHGFKILLASWKARWANRNNEKNTGPTSSQQTEVVARSEELGTDNVVYLNPTNDVWNDAWHVTEGLIVQMRDEVQSHGAKFVAVTLSNGPQVFPDAAVRKQFTERFGISDLFYPDNRIKLLGDREGLQVITLAPELQSYADKNKVYLHGFGSNIGNGHWNIEGHRIAGELLAEKLCAAGPLE